MLSSQRKPEEIRQTTNSDHSGRSNLPHELKTTPEERKKKNERNHNVLLYKEIRRRKLKIKQKRKQGRLNFGVTSAAVV